MSPAVRRFRVADGRRVVFPRGVVVGPGATNLVSAIADAFMDSIPLVAITGQVFSKYIGKMAFQETDFYGMTLPIVKHSYLVMDV